MPLTSMPPCCPWWNGSAEEELAVFSQELTNSIRNWATETLLPNMDSIITQVGVQVSGVVTGVFNVLVGFIVSFTV